MPTSASDILSEPLDKIADLIAGGAVFQSWTGTASTAAAKAYCYIQATEVFTRPGVVISWRRATVGRGGYVRGLIQLIFEATTPAAYVRGTGAEKTDHTSATYAFLNSVGGIVRQIMEQAEGSGIPVVLSAGVDSTHVVARSDLPDGEDYYQSVWLIPYGLVGGP